MHHSPSSRFTVLFAVLATLAFAACNQQAPAAMNDASGSSSSMMAMESGLMPKGDIVWKDAGPALPPGARLAVLEGDTTKPGPFTIRFNFPAGYTIAPHTHPTTEHVTIIEGSIGLGMGNTFDKSALKTLSAGDFALIQTGMAHFAWTQSGVIIQIHGTGPYGRTYVNPADDPRNAVK